MQSSGYADLVGHFARHSTIYNGEIMIRKATFAGAAAISLLSACASIVSTCAFAQTADWPIKPIRIIVHHPAGFGADINVRKMAPQLTQLLGQPVVVENRPGGGGRIAATEGVRSAADGYTFFTATNETLYFLPFAGAKLAYDAEKDITSVALFSLIYPLLVVGEKSPVKQFSDFAKLGRPPTLGVLGLGGFYEAHGYSFSRALRQPFTLVPYGSKSPTLEVVGGNIDASLMFGAEADGLVESGKIRVIAATNPAGNPRYTTAPALARLVGDSFDLPGWAVLAAPAATPAAIVSKMRDAVNSTLVTEPYKSWSERPGSIPPPVLDAAALAQFLAQQKRDVAEVVKRANLKTE